MTTDVIELNNFTVLVEQSYSEETTVATCGFNEDIIGFAFYGSGNVELEVNYGSKSRTFQNTTGTAISFFGNHNVEFAHTVSHDKPLRSITVFAKLKNLESLTLQEGMIFQEHLSDLLEAEEDFVEGPHFLMTPEMKLAVDKILNNQYTGSSRSLFLKSQVTELLSHYFALFSQTETESLSADDIEKLYLAREILISNLETPPSLNELVKQTGLNSFKLKKNFKKYFGVPVFKFLQNERLNKAHQLLSNQNIGIQQAAWSVGYESLSSFSNAFTSKFGFRPSEIKK